MLKGDECVVAIGRFLTHGDRRHFSYHQPVGDGVSK
jgi:hypothetical protein